MLKTQGEAKEKIEKVLGQEVRADTIQHNSVMVKCQDINDFFHIFLVAFTKDGVGLVELEPNTKKTKICSVDPSDKRTFGFVDVSGKLRCPFVPVLTGDWENFPKSEDIKFVSGLENNTKPLEKPKAQNVLAEKKGLGMAG